MKEFSVGGADIVGRVLHSGRELKDNISLIFSSKNQSKILSREDQVTLSLKKGRTYPLALFLPGFINLVYHV